MTYDLYIEELDLEVELDCHVSSESTGIGSYEYMGHREYDEGDTYLIIDEMEWDKTLYTPEENVIIEKYIDEHRDSIEEKALANYDPY